MTLKHPISRPGTLLTTLFAHGPSPHVKGLAKVNKSARIRERRSTRCVSYRRYLVTSTRSWICGCSISDGSQIATYWLGPTTREAFPRAFQAFSTLGSYLQNRLQMRLDDIQTRSLDKCYVSYASRRFRARFECRTFWFQASSRRFSYLRQQKTPAGGKLKKTRWKKRLKTKQNWSLSSRFSDLRPPMSASPDVNPDALKLSPVRS